MHPVITALARHAAARPRHAALADERRQFGYGALYRNVTRASVDLHFEAANTVALAIDNGPAWLTLDLGCLAARLRCVPIPSFFSPAQQLHCLLDAGVDLLVTDRPAFYAELLAGNDVRCERAPEIDIGGTRLAPLRIRGTARALLPAQTAKITYTSGTTGTPKGVCLDGAAIARVTQSLAAAVKLGTGDRHVSLLPLATLLENVATYAVLLAGGTCIVPPLAAVGMQGAAHIEPQPLLTQLAANQATTAITTPQMLSAVLDALAAGAARPPALRFLAVGGAALAAALLERSVECGLPAYQGYGLSECASVVTLNTPAANRRGSVGCALPHATLEIADDGEIFVSGATLLGYTGSNAPAEKPWPTGDVGYIEDGFLHLTGRKRNIFVTSYGRNVSPEWVEAELTAHPAIAQAWVYGEGQPWAAAVITPACSASAAVDAAVGATNARLPDYARVRAWAPSERPFSFESGELTANGRLRREALLTHYGSIIERLYMELPEHVL